MWVGHQLAVRATDEDPRPVTIAGDDPEAPILPDERRAELRAFDPATATVGDVIIDDLPGSPVIDRTGRHVLGLEPTTEGLKSVVVYRIADGEWAVRARDVDQVWWLESFEPG